MQKETACRRSLLLSAAVPWNGQSAKGFPGDGKFSIVLPGIPWYNRREKQKCGGLRVRQHPQACTGESPPIQRHQTVSAWNIIRHSTLVCKGCLCRICSCHFLLGGICFSHCADLPAQCFCFLTGPRGRKRPWESRLNYRKEYSPQKTKR